MRGERRELQQRGKHVMAQSEEPERVCQCPIGLAECKHDMTQEDLLCDACRKVHKPNFPANLALPAGVRIPCPPEPNIGEWGTPVSEPAITATWDNTRYMLGREEF